MSEFEQDPASILDPDAETVAAMEEIDRSIVGTLKTCFVVGKTLFTILGTLQAVVAWNKSKKAMKGPAQLLLLFNVCITAGILAYKLSSKHIAPLFLLQGLSFYSAFCVLHVLVGYVECEKAAGLKQKLAGLFKLIHFLYIVLLFVSYPQVECGKEDFYPHAFLLTNCLFLGVYLMVLTLHQRDYLLEWGAHEQAAKDLFKAQTDRYFSTYTFLVEWHLFELVLAKLLDAFTDSVFCSSDGQQWHYKTGKGVLFIMLHIIGTSVGTGMPRAVFIKTCKDASWFGGLGDEDESPAPKKESKKTK